MKAQHTAEDRASGFGTKDGGAVDEERKDVAVAEGQERVCSSCRAWVAIRSQHAEIGRCHRHPPQVVHGPETDTLEGYSDSVWPETAPDEFCCDWLSREEAR